MDFCFTSEHERIRETSRRLAADFATRTTQHDRDTSLPLENYAALKREGFYSLTVPQDLGGWGAGFLGWTVAAEELAQGCPATALSFNMHVAAVETIMDDPQVPATIKQHTAAFVQQEQKLLAYSVTEPGASSLVLGASYAPSVQARRVRGGYVLRGRKAFQSMVEGCDSILMLVHPAEDANPLAGMLLLVPYPTSGQRIEEVWDTLGMRGTRKQPRIGRLFRARRQPVLSDRRLCHVVCDLPDVGVRLLLYPSVFRGRCCGLPLVLRDGEAACAARLCATPQLSPGYPSPSG
jgi:alkylation response protein AidB-like acyl-CoA dehydrogenase